MYDARVMAYLISGAVCARSRAVFLRAIGNMRAMRSVIAGVFNCYANVMELQCTLLFVNVSVSVVVETMSNLRVLMLLAVLYTLNDFTYRSKFKVTDKRRIRLERKLLRCGQTKQ